MGSDPYTRVADLLSWEEYEARIRQKVEEWGGMIDDDAAALLVLDDLGRNRVQFDTIATMVEGSPVRLRVRVDTVGEARTYRGRGRKQGRILPLVVGDDTGRCTLLLRDDDAEAVEVRGPVGLRLRLLGFTPRRGPEGMELVGGRWGRLEVEAPGHPAGDA